MKDKLVTKIKDFVNYTSISVKMFRDQLYSDSATNCRKACEAACKTIIYNHYPEKVADNKISNLSLKELIVVLIKDGLAERKAINWLESMQIIGNKAAHDNQITKEEAAYSLNALNLITEWLFLEKLKIALPEELPFKQLDKKEEQKLIEKVIIQEQIIREKISEETEKEIYNRLKDIDDRAKSASESYKELKEGLEQAHEAIRKINTPQPDPETPPSAKPKNKTRVIVFIAGGILLLTASLFFLLRNTKQKTDESIAFIKHPDSIYIGINRLNILQDNPNIDFKIEEILQNTFGVLQGAGLPIVLKKTDLSNKVYNQDSLLANEALRTGFDYFIFGDLFESALKDSNLLKLRVCSSGKQIEYKNLNFVSAADSQLINSISGICASSVLNYVEANKRQYKEKKLLDLLGLAHFTTHEQRFLARKYSAVFLTRDSVYQKALPLLTSLLSDRKNDPDLLLLKGDLFFAQKKYDSAEVYFKSAYNIDSTHLTTIFDLATLYYNTNKPPECYRAVTRALAVNPKNDTANYWMGLFTHRTNTFPLTRMYCLRCFKSNPEFSGNNFLLGELYGFAFNKRDSAEYFYHLASPDSSDPTVTARLASYYAQFYPDEKDRIKLLLSKSDNQKSKDNQAKSYAEGLIAFEQYDYKKSIKLLEPLYESGWRKSQVLMYLCQSYYFEGNVNKGMFYATEAMKFDSLDGQHVFLYAFLSSLTNPKSFAKNNFYFRKAIKMNPTDHVIDTYRTYLFKSNQIEFGLKEAKELYKIKPTSKSVNAFLGDFYGRTGDYKNAIPHYEFLHALDPGNDTITIQLAQCIFPLYKTTDEIWLKWANTLKRIADSNPRNSFASYILAMYMSKGRNKEEARKYYLQAKRFDNSIFDKGMEEYIR